MALFKKSLSVKPSETTQTVSEEKEELLPENKKTLSSIAINKTNTLLIFSSIATIVIFIIIMIVRSFQSSRQIRKIAEEPVVETTVSQDSNKDSSDTNKKSEEKKEDIYIPPVVTLEPNSITIEGQTIGDETFKSINLSVLNNPIKILEVKTNEEIKGLVLNNEDCLNRENINNNCIITITWKPETKEDKSIFVTIKYNELNNNNIVAEKVIQLPLELKSIEVKIEEEKSETKEEKDDSIDELEDDFSKEQETQKKEIPQPSLVNEVTETPAPIFSDISKKTVSFNDCKKYASKAYDFSGTFIGWVQGDNKVFSPNCSNVIGLQEEDGMIKATGTGVIIGKGVVIDNKRAEEKRVELTLPLLNNIIKQGRPKEVNFDNIRSNRKNIKASTQKINSFNYRVEDELKIREGLLKNKIPFSITDMKQLSTMPKDERYVLRQSKPIPAALNKAIFISSDTDTKQEITATVEKNVFGGDGRTIIIPAGSQLIGVAEGKKSGLISVQKINIKWDRLIRPDGVEFNLTGMNYSADAQGRAGVPGKNDTGYMKQLFIKPLLYSALPVAMEALFPTSSKYVKRTFNAEGYNAIGKAQAPNNYNFDWQNTQELRELSPKDKMKAEIEQNFKSVIHKLIEDSAKQQIPFTVPAGTRIQVYLTKDIMLRVNESINSTMLENANDSKNKLQDSKFTPTIDNTVSQSTSGFGTGSTSAEINEPEDTGDDAGDEEPEGAEEEE